MDSPRSTSPPKSACPGVSTTLTVVPCQSDVPVRADDPELPTAPPGVDWRHVRLPAPQPSLPAADAGKPKPARRPGRIDVARVGVPEGG